MAKDNYIAEFHHLVFSTKNRARVLDPQTSEQLYRYILGCSKEGYTKIIRVNGMSDHIHILFSVRSGDFMMSSFVRELKKSTNKFLSTIFHHNRFAWQRGYFSCSVSPRDVDDIKRYIDNQKQHHTMRSFEDEMAKILELVDINTGE